MTYGIYPGSTPELRILEKEDGTTTTQVRYVNIAQGYTSKWMDIKMEKENGTSNSTNTPSHL